MYSAGVFVLFACVLTNRVESSAEQGSCLLARRKHIAKTVSLAQHAVVQRATVHRAWRLHHEELQRASIASKSALDAYVANKRNSSDACDKRVEEAKNLLDDLTDDVKDLEDQVKQKQNVLEAETDALDQVEEAIKAVKDEHEEAVAKCEEHKKEAIADLAKYTKQQEELDSIAVASKGAGPVSLLGAAVTLDRQSCLAFVQYARRVKALGVQEPATQTSGVPAPDDATCDEQRAKLQENFEEAYEENKEILKDAEKRAEDNTCKEAADAKKAVALAPLTPQQKETSEPMEKASEELASLNPVLDQTKGRVEKLKDHIDEDLKPECEAADKVTDALEKIHDELESLKNCPNQEDFSLEVPEVNDSRDPQFQVH